MENSISCATNLESSFPSGQFIIKGCSTPFRLDRNQNEGVLFTLRMPRYPMLDFEWMHFRKTYRKCFPLHKKWSFPLIRISPVNVTKSAGNCGFGHIYWRHPSCSDNSNTNLIANHLRSIGRRIDFYSSMYNFVVLGDLNTKISNSFLE